MRNGESLAAEMVAFANSEGGTVYIGVADDASMPGLPDAPAELTQLLQNMNLATDDGHLNLAGVLLFAEQPEWIKPQFVIKAIRYPGNQIHVSEYIDTEDFAGPLPKVFNDALAFVMRNLHKTQAGRGVNAPGQPEISDGVFEELLVNALVHRDYLVNAPIRLFIFDNRIEIISPGHLPNNLTVEKIRTGHSNIRNPILVSYVAKGLLPYHGLGSGIKRALSLWPKIEFTDDREGCLFTTTVHRMPVKASFAAQNEGVNEGVNTLQNLISTQPGLRSPALAQTLNTSPKTIERWLKQLKAQGLIEFRGAPKTGGYHTTAAKVLKLK